MCVCACVCVCVCACVCVCVCMRVCALSLLGDLSNVPIDTNGCPMERKSACEWFRLNPYQSVLELGEVKKKSEKLLANSCAIKIFS